MDLSSWGWPQWVAVILLVLRMIGEIYSDAEDKNPSGAIANLGVFAIWVWVLWAGGFWR